MEKNADGSVPHPRAGVGILVQNAKGQILFGKRKSSHADGEWCFPGGHLEFGETIFDAARRELKEETGMDAEDMELISIADILRYVKTENKHYIGVGVRARCSGEPKVMEPEKCEGWRWFDGDVLPSPMLEANELILRNLAAGRIYQP